MNKAIFLDRDGVINKNAEEHDYVKSWDEFELLDGVIPALKLFRKLGYIVVVLTNQQGVSKGLMSKDTLEGIHKKLNELLSKSGVKIDGFYYCPHAGYDGCGCRKPKTGMIDKAVEEMGIDLSNSVLIGDRETDRKLGDDAGVKTVIINTDSNLYESVKDLFL